MGGQPLRSAGSLGGAVPSSLLPCRLPFCPGGYPSVCGGGRVQDCVEEEKEAAVSS